MSELIKTWAEQTSVREGGGRKVRYNSQGKINFGQGKVREFHFRLIVGT